MSLTYHLQHIHLPRMSANWHSWVTSFLDKGPLNRCCFCCCCCWIVVFGWLQVSCRARRSREGQSWQRDKNTESEPRAGGVAEPSRRRRESQSAAAGWTDGSHVIEGWCRQKCTCFWVMPCRTTVSQEQSTHMWSIEFTVLCTYATMDLDLSDPTKIYISLQKCRFWLDEWDFIIYI